MTLFKIKDSIFLITYTFILIVFFFFFFFFVIVGYTGDGFTCNDIDECEVNNGGCSVNPRVACLNTVGSMTCGPCPTGKYRR